MDDIGEKVLEELERRLKSPRDAAEIPGTQLMQIAQRYLAYLESQIKDDEEEGPRLTPLEAIDKPGLALEMRYKILSEYMDELHEEWQKASDRYLEMQRELGIEEEHDGDDAN